MTRCPQGKVLKLYARAHRTNRGEIYRRYRAARADCAACPRRARCLSRGAGRKSLTLPVAAQPATLSARMRRKIDEPESRRIYGRRLAIVEPVFANLRSNKRLDRFTYRGQHKVNIQWLLYCLVHNIEKLAHKSKNLRPEKALAYSFASLPKAHRLLQTPVPDFFVHFHSLLVPKPIACDLAPDFSPSLPDLIIRQPR